MIVVVVEAALADRYGAGPNESAQRIRCGARIVQHCLVRMHARCERKESGVLLRERLCTSCCGDRFTDNSDTDRTSRARPVDDGIAILVERRVDQVRVRVEEGDH